MSIPLVVIVIFNLFSLPVFFTIVLDSYGQITWFRSFSIYNLVFSDRRRRLSEENLKSLVFMYYKSFISYEYHESLNFDASLCRFCYSCFDIK